MVVSSELIVGRADLKCVSDCRRDGGGKGEN